MPYDDFADRGLLSLVLRCVVLCCVASGWLEAGGAVDAICIALSVGNGQEIPLAASCS